MVFGCTLAADVPIQHDSVSERHALLEASEDGYMLSDLGSAEGTFIGGRRLSPGERRALVEGGSFLLGKIEVILAPDEEIGRATEEELLLEPEAEAQLRVQMEAVPNAAKATASVPGKARGRGTRKPEEKGRHVPAARRRAEKLRAKRTAFFWTGIAVTVLLLALAAFFIYRIASQKGDGSAKENVEQPSR